MAEPTRRFGPEGAYFLAAAFGLSLAAELLDAAGRPGLLAEGWWFSFAVLTVWLGGWAAWRTGRAIAGGWRPYTHVVLYMLPFAFIVRWIHFALVGGALLSIQHYLIALAICLAFATLGYRQVRVRQMTTQYRWLYHRSGPFSWRRAG